MADSESGGGRRYVVLAVVIMLLAALPFSPLVSFILLWNYGIGIMHAKFSLITGSSTSQIDDRDRDKIS